jgi:hypothetical protein
MIISTDQIVRVPSRSKLTILKYRHLPMGQLDLEHGFFVNIPIKKLWFLVHNGYISCTVGKK